MESETQTPTPLTDENEIQDHTNDENESENSTDNVKTKKAKKEKKDSPNFSSGDVINSSSDVEENLNLKFCSHLLSAGCKLPEDKKACNRIQWYRPK